MSLDSSQSDSELQRWARAVLAAGDLSEPPADDAGHAAWKAWRASVESVIEARRQAGLLTRDFLL